MLLPDGVKEAVSEKHAEMLEALSERNQILCEEWKRLHADDPCVRCGSRDGVEIIPTGSLAKLTPVCLQCRAAMHHETRLYHAAWDAGYNAGWNAARPWWRRPR